MIKKLLLLLLVIGMIAKRPDGGDETPEERRRREEDEMWGSHGNSATLEEHFTSVRHELDEADTSVDSTPSSSTGPQGAWDTDDERITSDYEDMTNLGHLTWERRNKIMYGDLNDPNAGGHHSDATIPGKTHFPKSWDEDDIAAGIQDTARNPDSVNPRAGSAGGYEAHKQIDGVDVTVILNKDGTIWAAYPTGGTGTYTYEPDGE